MTNAQVVELLESLSSDDRQKVFVRVLVDMDAEELMQILRDTFDQVSEAHEDRQIVVMTGLYRWEDGSVHDEPEGLKAILDGLLGGALSKEDKEADTFLDGFKRLAAESGRESKIPALEHDF